MPIVFAWLVYNLCMSRWVPQKPYFPPAAPEQAPASSLREISSRAFNRDRLLALDPTIIPTTEDKARAAHNPYRVRGPFAMTSRHI